MLAEAKNSIKDELISTHRQIKKTILRGQKPPLLPIRSKSKEVLKPSDSEIINLETKPLNLGILKPR